MKVNFKDLDSGEIEEWFTNQGLDAYRGRQVRQWLYKKLAFSFDEMSNLPKSIRSFLTDKACINNLEKIKTEVSEDGTEKYLFKLIDGHLIESVLIPEKDHFTICISSQAGCAMGCRFCLTAKQGFNRNLTSAEIIDQVIVVKRSMDTPDRLTNIVLMGMGEPLDNYSAVLMAMKNLISNDGMNFSHRKVTLSTCGIAPLIKKLGENIQVNLAVSLNAADDKTRNFLMPINRRYPIKTLISACRDFALPNRSMITFEYILIKGINDRDRDAYNIIRILSGLKAKINLIPLNPHHSLKMTPPSMEEILHFRQILIDNHFTAIIRKSKGEDILAACGQLSGRHNKME